MTQGKCKCEELPISYKDYSSTFLGSDNRSAEIEIRECVHCHQKWLQYFVEYEHLRESGRWYLGKIPGNKLVTVENSIEILQSLEWYFYGGSYFRTTGRIGKGTLYID